MTALTFATNDDNDIFIGGDGRLVLYRDFEAVLQACEHACKAQRGEMIFATDQGIPMFQSVWSGVANLAQFEAALRNAILNVVDVVEILSLFVSQDGDDLLYTATIRTTYGEGVING